MILNIHGFASGGDGAKKQALEELFGDKHEVISPDLSEDPTQALKQLKAIARRHYKFIVVGCSLGGFYALYLSLLTKGPIVLVNPSTNPAITLANRLGSNKNFKTGKDFDFKAEYLESLKELADEIETVDLDLSRYTVLLGLQDDTIAPNVAKQYLKGATFFEYDTDHRFSIFETVFRENKHLQKLFL